MSTPRTLRRAAGGDGRGNAPPNGVSAIPIGAAFMRYRYPFAVALMAVFLGTPVYGQTTFSHQIHLNKVGATCTDCHVSATSSTQATDSNLPPASVCLTCHNGETAKKIDTSALAEWRPAERTFRFNHEFHSQMGNVAPILAAAIDGRKYLGKVGDMRRHLDTENTCAACHRGLGETGLATAANLPQMSDCLVCHNRIDNPFSCEKCHLEGVNLKPANHANDFLDRHSTGKLGLDKTTCLPCHGKNFTCMGCH